MDSHVTTPEARRGGLARGGVARYGSEGSAAGANGRDGRNDTSGRTGGNGNGGNGSGGNGNGGNGGNGSGGNGNGRNGNGGNGNGGNGSTRASGTRRVMFLLPGDPHPSFPGECRSPGELSVQGGDSVRVLGGGDGGSGAERVLREDELEGRGGEVSSLPTPTNPTQTWTPR